MNIKQWKEYDRNEPNLFDLSKIEDPKVGDLISNGHGPILEILQLIEIRKDRVVVGYAGDGTTKRSVKVVSVSEYRRLKTTLDEWYAYRKAKIDADFAAY